MFKLEMVKPDGRHLTLYGREPIVTRSPAPSPYAEVPAKASAHMRWHPLLGEWVAYAGHRQNRTFLPPPEFNPLAPMKEGGHPTELPDGDYDVAVFENLFPALSYGNEYQPDLLNVKTRSAQGVCEVVVFTKDSNTSLGHLATSHIDLIIQVWTERYRALGALPEIQYVLPFENRGVEVGVTLHHPHGQIYAYPFIPPIPAKKLAEQYRYFERNGRNMVSDFIAAEEADGRRILWQNEYVSAFVPSCARYPYEVWIAPRRACQSLVDLTAHERLGFAQTLKAVLLKFDGLWQRRFPYLMVIHQAPTDGNDHPYAHLLFEFYPPYRTKDRLKYLAGTELGAGMFANDALPEDKAAELRDVEVAIE